MSTGFTRPEVGGVILAGGRSSRFGSDKASALLCGRPLLQWVAGAVAEVCGELVVVRARGQLLPATGVEASLTVVDDRYEARGPLAGIVTGFHETAQRLCFVTSCDAPLLRPEVIRLLAAEIGDFDAAVPYAGGFRQPLVALYRRDRCLPAFEAHLAGGDGRILGALEQLRVRDVREADVLDVDPGLDSFRNANDPAALAEIAHRVEADAVGRP
ncbi:MAG: molybdenum cofactor guanylyltransferase [Chloroflexi bacterium]|nr:molybdenum cofactor guanylyltransferase [Chloroflexota bacterium]